MHDKTTVAGNNHREHTGSRKNLPQMEEIFVPLWAFL